MANGKLGIGWGSATLSTILLGGAVLASLAVESARLSLQSSPGGWVLAAPPVRHLGEALDLAARLGAAAAVGAVLGLALCFLLHFGFNARRLATRIAETQEIMAHALQRRIVPIEQAHVDELHKVLQTAGVRRLADLENQIAHLRRELVETRALASRSKEDCDAQLERDREILRRLTVLTGEIEETVRHLRD